MLSDPMLHTIFIKESQFFAFIYTTACNFDVIVVYITLCNAI